MITAVYVMDANGVPHEFWLDGMQMRVSGIAGEGLGLDSEVTITGTLAEAPTATHVGPRQIVSEQGRVLGTYRESEKWETRRH